MGGRGGGTQQATAAEVAPCCTDGVQVPRPTGHTAHELAPPLLKPPGHVACPPEPPLLCRQASNCHPTAAAATHGLSHNRGCHILKRHQALLAGLAGANGSGTCQNHISRLAASRQRTSKLAGLKSGCTLPAATCATAALQALVGPHHLAHLRSVRGKGSRGVPKQQLRCFPVHITDARTCPTRVAHGGGPAAERGQNHRRVAWLSSRV